MELDVMVPEQSFGAAEFPVDGAQGRTPVSGDVAGGVQPRRHVAAALHQHQAHQGLGAGQEDTALIQCIFVVQRDLGQWHRPNPLGFARCFVPSLSV